MLLNFREVISCIPVSLTWPTTTAALWDSAWDSPEGRGAKANGSFGAEETQERAIALL